MTQWLNTLANLIQQYIWLAPVLALVGGLVTSFTPCSLSSVPMVIAYIGGSAKNDTKKAFRLSLTMAGGLALTFLVFGSLASVLVVRDSWCGYGADGVTDLGCDKDFTESST